MEDQVGTWFSRLRARLVGEGGLRVLLAGMVILYVVILFSAQVAKFESLEMGFDLALEEQILWNTVNGRFLATSTLEGTEIDLGRDVIPLQLLVALPYKLAPSPYTILLLQTLAVALGAVPLFALARLKLGPGAAITLAFCYLSYVPLHWLNLYEFQPRAFALGPLFALFYHLERGLRRGFFWSLAACLATRSDVALTVAMAGVFALLSGKRKSLGVSALLIGTAWVLLVLGLVVPHFTEARHFRYFEWYANLGATPREVLLNLLTSPRELLASSLEPAKLAFLFRIYSPLAFLPLLSPGLLLVASPNLAMSLLGSRPILWDIRYQYPTMLYGTAFVGVVYALARLRGAEGSARRRLRAALVGGLLAFMAGHNVAYHALVPLPTWGFLVLPYPTPDVLALEQVARRIPNDASLAVANRVGPRLAQRRQLYAFPAAPLYSEAGIRRADYVLLDLDAGRHNPAIVALRRDKAWLRIADRGRFELYRRRSYVRRLRSGSSPQGAAPVIQP